MIVERVTSISEVFTCNYVKCSEKVVVAIADLPPRLSDLETVAWCETHARHVCDSLLHTCFASRDRARLAAELVSRIETALGSGCGGGSDDNDGGDIPAASPDGGSASTAQGGAVRPGELDGGTSGSAGKGQAKRQGAGPGGVA